MGSWKALLHLLITSPCITLIWVIHSQDDPSLKATVAQSAPPLTPTHSEADVVPGPALHAHCQRQSCEAEVTDLWRRATHS